MLPAGGAYQLDTPGLAASEALALIEALNGGPDTLPAASQKLAHAMRVSGRLSQNRAIPNEPCFLIGRSHPKAFNCLNPRGRLSYPMRISAHATIAHSGTDRIVLPPAI
jgi:hypothetical protein